MMSEKKYKKKPLAVVHVKPITGALGTTVHPGEEVMMVRSGWGNSVGCDKGTYVGYIISVPTGNLRARVSMEQKYNSWHFHDGREFDWKTDYNSATYGDVQKSLVLKEKTRTVYITLNLNRIAAIK
jgi:hypothetical protein